MTGFRLPAIVVAAAGLAACSPAPIERGINDPHEAANRKMHETNVALDTALLGPVSEAYGGGFPQPVRERVSDFAANTALPSLIVNKLLQGKIDDAVHNSVRFLFNAVIGLGGLFDPASDIGLEERGTDFGETLHVWGMREGAYVVLPFFGPSTERDAIGLVVDFFTNPLSYHLPHPHNRAPTVAWFVDRFGDRYTFSESVSQILYEGEDPYATARLYYLDSRRYDLGEAVPDEELYDLYEEVYD